MSNAIRQTLAIPSQRVRLRGHQTLCIAASAIVLVLVAAARGQSGGPYVIKKSTIDGGGETAMTGGSYSTSGTVGQPDVATISGGPYTLYGGFWSPAFLVPDPLLAESPAISKVRHLTFVVPPSSAGTLTALRVELTSLHHPSNPPPGTPDFSEMEGEVRYVNSYFGDVLCVDSNTFQTFFRCGKLSCEPEYRDWATDLSGATNPPSPPGLIHVTGDAVVPSSTLQVSHIAAGCGGLPAATTCSLASDPLTVSTARWGDVSGSGGGPSDGQANVIDIGHVVNKVKGLADALPEQQMWLKNPTNIAGVSINVVDIGLTVDAVKGLPYPYAISTCP